ncbi:MAG: DNA translocase FtsK [Verrucomicrobiota bacterium]
MLFIPPGTAVLQRVQGAFVGAALDGLDDLLHELGPAVLIVEEVDDGLDLLLADEGGGSGDGEDGEDPLVMQCWAIIRETRRASVSMLQRRLKLGYNRAARIMDILHEKGYVGPENGSSPREILVD